MSATSRARPPRRAILLADPRAGYRLTRSRGWASEAAALDAVRLVDTNVASAAVHDLAGFFALGANDFAVVRGGVAHASDGTDRCWREAVGLGAREFARVRCNPFRILPRMPSMIDEPGGAQLDPPELPDATQAADDLSRLVTLCDDLANDAEGSDASADPHRETLLAALLESAHTLVVGPAVSYEEIELLLLLLPAPLRLELTFQSHALSTPAPPVPRLVVAPDDAAGSFAANDTVWTQRLPDTRPSIGPRARRVASELLALLETPERLVEAHVVFERYAERLQLPHRLLLDEVETLLRFVRMRRCRDGGDAAGALHVVGDSLVAHADAVHPEPRWAFELMRKAFSPAAIGEAVAASFPGGTPAVSAYAIEQFALQRRGRADEFDAFARPIQESAASMLLVRDDDVSGRLRTLLVLLAAARADVPAMVAALRVPPDAALVDRLGGADAWASGDDLAADALRAFLETDTTEGVAAAIAMLGALAPELPAGRDRLGVVELVLDFARLGLRRLPADDWRDALPLADAAMQLCQTITFSDRVSLDGRPDSQHYHELLSRAMNPGAQFDVTRNSDADVFFGFLGADAARSRLARREVDDRGEVLVREVDARIRRATTDKGSSPQRGEAGRGVRPRATAADHEAAAAEGVHWSFALLDRVRRGELDAHYVGLGVRLLERSGVEPSLMSYIEAHPTIAPALLTHTQPRDFLGPTEFTVLSTAALAATLDEAREKRDPDDVAALCQQLRSAGVLLRATDVDGAIEEPLRLLVDRLHQNSLRPVEMHVSTLNRALTPILAPDALAIVRSILRVRAKPTAPAAGGWKGDPASRGGWLSRVIRRGASDPTLLRNRLLARLPDDAEPRADAPLQPPVPGPAGPPRGGRKRRRRDRTAAVALGVAILSMVVVLLSSETGRRALFRARAEGGGAASPAATRAAALAPRPVLAPTARLERARASALEENWTEVVDLLSGDALDRAYPEAFAWDSLLASAALRQAEQLPRDETGQPGRRRLLELARDRAGDALDAEPVTRTAADLMRLMRAEACLSGDLVCENANVLVDLALAVESTDAEIADRADELIRSRW